MIPKPGLRIRPCRALLLAAVLWGSLVGPGAAAGEGGLEISVSGVSGAAAENVRVSVGGGLGATRRLATRRDRARFLREAEDEAVIALRPFGYYQASAEASLSGLEDGGWRLDVKLTPGPVVRVAALDLRLEGLGANHPELADWRDGWPLEQGAVLDQALWEGRKRELLDLAAEWGFFRARFDTARIALDLERNEADLTLVLQTGPRAVFGALDFDQDLVDEEVLRGVARFSPGEPYRAWVMDQFRTDLWKLGYFSAIDVDEKRDLDADPPRVDVVARFEPIHRDTHQGTLGYGTDTEFRTQYRWQRHRISDRGDSATAGFAWQTRFEELQLFGEYRLPRHTDNQQYWLVSPSYQDRQQRIALDVEGQDESLRIGEGRVQTLFVRGGRARIRHLERSREPIIETFYVEYLREENRIDELFLDPLAALPEPLARSFIERSARTQTLALGVEWDWPDFRGQGFGLRGHRERAWLFTANEVWGSDLDFTQAYLSSRWTLPLAPRWRLLLRGEVGYTDADVQELTLAVGDATFLASVTDLPFRYRFFAGGSQSVRGYDFEALSNNGIGSNHLLTASVEVEYRLFADWSVAAFADTGNAFNDWDAVDARTGLGVGVRWYAAGFPLRLDVAQAQDLDGKPWRIHFTIGSPLF